MAGYEPLTARDAVFLHIGDENAPMQFGAVLVFGGPGLSADGNAFDIGRLRALIQSRLHRFPRLRQKLLQPGWTSEPVWVDDECFELRYHVRHVALPSPATERSLKELAGSIVSQRLDAARPLWELWAVEGLEGWRFGIVCKVHHCVTDGVAGLATLVGILLGVSPDGRIEPARPWKPRVRPSAGSLFARELRRRVSAPAGFWSGAQTAAATILRSPGKCAGDFAESMSKLLVRASDTPLNGPVGPSRRLDWVPVDLEEVRAVRQAFGGTLTAVLIATVAGAARGYLLGRGVDADSLDFRALVPVNPAGAPASETGNRVSALITRIPVSVTDPRRRLAEARRLMDSQKEKEQVASFEVMAWIAEQTHSVFAAWINRTAMRAPLYNMMVTNIPGPPLPLYLLEAPLLEAYPAAQLYAHQALSVAVLSYHGRLFWGFTADPEMVPDLGDFVDHVLIAFRDLVKAAEGA